MTKIEYLSHCSTIAAAVITGISVILVGLQIDRTFKAEDEKIALEKENLSLEYEVQAAEIYSKYIEVKLLASTEKRYDYFWVSSAAIHYAEQLFLLLPNESSWRESSRWILEKEKDFIIKTGIDCRTTTDEFDKFVAETYGLEKPPCAN